VCAYYENGTEKIKQGDTARYLTREITILEAKHIKSSKRMRIVYLANEREITLEVPYKTVIGAMDLVSRKPTPPKINEMGQEVVEGYACKPKDFDATRPIMHFKYQLYICEGERCAKAGKVDKSAQLRAILKRMGLNQGQHRIKISRAGCFGACRFRQVAQCVANTQANGDVANNALWFRQTHQWSEAQWERLFEALRDDTPLSEVVEEEAYIPMRVYG